MIAKNNIKTKVGDLALPNFKVFYKATVIRQCGTEFKEQNRKFRNRPT